MSLAPDLALSRSTLELSLWFTGFSSADSIFQVKLFKEDLLVRDMIFYRQGKSDTVIDNLDTGVYQIEFRNVFHRQILREVKLTKDTLYREYLEIDAFNPDKDTFGGFIEMLKDKERFTLTYMSIGCFHAEEQDIVISRLGDRYTAKIYPEHKGFKKQKKGKPIIKVLTKEDIFQFKIFEKWMLIHKDSLEGSTEQTSYYLRFKDNLWILEMDDQIRKDYRKLRKIIFKDYR